MPSDTRQLDLDIPIEDIWNFMRDENNWAPLVPGYLHHEKGDDGQISWEFKSDLGIMKKKVHLFIDIKEWNEPVKVSFELKRSNEKFLGAGYIEAKAVNRNKTRIVGFLDINASGPMGTLANSLFKKAVQLNDDEVTQAISTLIADYKKTQTL